MTLNIWGKVCFVKSHTAERREDIILANGIWCIAIMGCVCSTISVLIRNEGDKNQHAHLREKGGD